MKKFEIVNRYDIHQGNDLRHVDEDHLADTFEEAVEKATAIVKRASRNETYYIVEIKSKVTGKTPEDLIKVEIENI